MHAQAHELTCDRRIDEVDRAKHCARTRKVCTPKYTGLRPLGTSLRLLCQTLYTYTYSVHVQAHGRTYNSRIAWLPVPNTIQVQVQCTRPRSCTHVQWMVRLGCPCQTLCKHKCSVHAHIHASTHDRCITQTARAEHCICSRSGCTPTHAHLRMIRASLRRPIPNTVHIHVRGARSVPLACNGCTVKATHNRYTALTTHA